MKIALTTSGNDLNAPLDSRFGRAPKFIIYDLEGNSFEVVDNEQNLNAAQGAGIQSAQTVARLGVGALVTGHCGPKAFRVLQAAGIKIYNTSAATVTEALDQYCGGKLAEASSADVDGHWT
jgi:predicted Fe-Mo cluster-binding NifX family protein